jgi:hypothetical protein
MENGAMSHLKGSIASKATIGCDNMEVRIEILKIAESLDNVNHHNPDTGKAIPH